MTFLASLRVRVLHDASATHAAAPAPGARHVALLVAAALTACSDAAHDAGDTPEARAEAGLGDAGTSGTPPHDASTGVLDSSAVRDAGSAADTSTPLPSSDAALTDTGAPGM
ncbi:MAG TPA: hypothetical protein VJU61_11820, partial [Polyangiaceae bacterium]|nr:hypothetical protein [Polyangiaceae bacterium]